MELGRYLTLQLINELQQQMQDIEHKLALSGFYSMSTPQIETQTVEYSFLPSNILSLFNMLEANTQKIDTAIYRAWVNPYSGYNIWSRNNGEMYDNVKRWFDWAQYHIDVLNGVEPMWQKLYEEDEKTIICTVEDGVEDELLTNEGYFTEEY